MYKKILYGVFIIHAPIFGMMLKRDKRPSDVELLGKLARCGYTFERYNEEESLLHEACRVHSKKVVRFLLRNKVPQKADDMGFTPLHEACYWGRFDLIDILLLYDADINAQDKFDKTPLDAACDMRCRTHYHLGKQSTIDSLQLRGAKKSSEL